MTEGWTGLDLRQLTALQAIAREGSFKAAARALGYTPSAISQQIASLERIVGAQVIAREHGRQALGPTDAGRILLRHLAAIEARFAAARAELDALRDGAVGTLRVGAYESVGSRLLPDVVAGFREEFPRIRLEVYETLSDLEQLNAVERAELDLAFTLFPLPSGPFEAVPVLRDAWVLVAQVGSTLVPAGGLDLRAIAELPLVCFRAPRAMEIAIAPFRAAGIQPNVVVRSDYNDALQELAANGRGVALMPLLAVNQGDTRTTIVPIGDVIPPREIVLAWHGDRVPSAALETFVALATQAGSRIERANAGEAVGPDVRLGDAAGAGLRFAQGLPRADPRRRPESGRSRASLGGT